MDGSENNSTTGTLRPLEMLPPGYAKFLGDVVARWAIVEHVMTNCIHLLTGMSRLLAQIVARDPPRAADKMDLIRELLEVNKILPEIDIILLKQKVIAAEQSRNILSHSVWFILEGTERVFLVKTAAAWKPPGSIRNIPRRIVPEAVEWALTDFRPAYLQLSEALNSLDDLYRELLERTASPNTPL